MCGVFAVLSRSGPLGDDYARERDLLAHRGPDGAGAKLLSVEANGQRFENRVWIGHRRLSIIDLADRSLQPMLTQDGRYALILNGEIYNYKELREECRAAGATFQTESDTEVLLVAWSLWGEAILPRLGGMFAFVIVDRSAGKAWIVRDAFGIKPLHFVLGPDKLFLSSEIWPLLATGAVEPKVDPVQAYEFIRFGASLSENETLIEGILRVPPASVTMFDFATGLMGTARRYWTLAPTHRSISYVDAVTETRERFLANVRLHLRSDVPVGAALSGGIDSSAIVCAMRHIEPDMPIRTFSFISAQPEQSEEKWVDIVNAAINAEAHKIRPVPEDLVADLEHLVRAQGEPFGSASIYAQFRVFREAREAGVPVTLDGQGADELLGGYGSYLGTVGASAIHAMNPIALWRLMQAGVGARGKMRMGADIVAATLPASLRRRFRSLARRELIPDFFASDTLAAHGLAMRDAGDAMVCSYRGLKEHLADSAVRTSLPTLLRIADRSSMAFSVESRVPFLTADFADFLLSLPPDYLVSKSGERKHIFRDAMRGILPDPIRERRDKIGFMADDSLWLRTNRSNLDHYWTEIDRISFLDPQKTRRFIAAFFDGKSGSATQVWRVLMFCVWQRQVRSFGKQAT